MPAGKIIGFVMNMDCSRQFIIASCEPNEKSQNQGGKKDCAIFFLNYNQHDGLRPWSIRELTRNNIQTRHKLEIRYFLLWYNLEILVR